MELPCSASKEKGPELAFLRRLPQIERRDPAGCIPSSKDRREFGGISWE